jgi:mannose-6-phosphate isomerase-like protein (cupin superfamily)
MENHPAAPRLIAGWVVSRLKECRNYSYLSFAKEWNMANYVVAQMDDVAPVQCPCGQSRRAFVSRDNSVATLHMVDIAADSRTHYHKKLTEIYLILEGTGHMELDGKLVPVKPLTAILIRPGCRHRAVGRLKVVNIPIPAFDPANPDEWFD